MVARSSILSHCYSCTYDVALAWAKKLHSACHERPGRPGRSDAAASPARARRHRPRGGLRPQRPSGRIQGRLRARGVGGLRRRARAAPAHERELGVGGWGRAPRLLRHPGGRTPRRRRRLPGGLRPRRGGGGASRALALGPGAPPELRGAGQPRAEGLGLRHRGRPHPGRLRRRAGGARRGGAADSRPARGDRGAGLRRQRGDQGHQLRQRRGRGRGRRCAAAPGRGRHPRPLRARLLPAGAHRALSRRHAHQRPRRGAPA